MNRKNGFTFVELLGVILLLGIVALIAVPAVNSVIKDSKQTALDKQLDSIFDSARNWVTKNIDLLPEGNGSILIKLETLKETGFLENKEIIDPVSEEEMNACVQITSNIEFNQYDYSYNEECYATNEILSSTNSCLTDKTSCAVGTEFTVKVNDSETKNFYVINEDNGVLTLLMDRNVDNETISWVQKSDYTGMEADWGENGNNNKGPLTALNYLESKTSGWTNIEAKSYTITDSVYGTITRTNARARMLTQTEANAIISSSWSYGNLDQPPYGYWTSSASIDYSGNAWAVNFGGYVHHLFVKTDDLYGVRPVIEVSKASPIY